MLRNAVILAGGKSSRMGEDKALLPFGGYPTMAEYQYRKLQKIFPNVYISAKENKFDFDANIILDRYSESSPMVAIASILDELKEDFFLLSVDMPLLSLEAIKKLVDVYNREEFYEVYSFKSPNGLEPTAAIYTNKIATTLKEFLKMESYKLMNILNLSKVKIVEWEFKNDFFNLNYREEYIYVKQNIHVKEM